MLNKRSAAQRIRRTLPYVVCLTLVLSMCLFQPGGVVRAGVGTWTIATPPQTAYEYDSARYGDGLWMMPGSNGAFARSTDNGATWTAVTNAGGGAGWYDTWYTGSTWVIVGLNGAIKTSADMGGTWTARTSGTTKDLWSITSDGTTLVAVGTVAPTTGNNLTTASNADPTSWSAHAVGAQNLEFVTYGGGQFVAVGDGGVIYTSPDGTAWTPRTSGVSAILYSVAYGNGMYVAVGTGGTILTSANGATWTPQTANTGAILYGVAFGGGQFVAVGTGGTILSSTSGASWASETSNTAQDLYRVGFDNRLFVAVGAHGTIATKAALSSNADLSNLVVSAGALSPAFSAGTTSYTAAVPYSTSSVNVTATVADAAATLQVNGSPATSGSAVSVPLAVGDNSIPVLVTAGDGTQKTYTITLSRAPASTNAGLSGLTLSAGTLTPAFATGTTGYTATVGSAVSSINVTPTVADSRATLKVNGTAATSGTAVSVPLTVGATTITVLLTAEDGTTQNTYTVVVTRLSNNASLSSLTLSQGALSPTFAAGTFSYETAVPHGTTSVDVTATPTDSNAALQVDGNPAAGGAAVPVTLSADHATAVTVRVTAEDPTVTQDYTIVIWPGPAFTGAQSNTSQLVSRGAGLTALAAAAVDGGPLTYSLASGTLPDGITLLPDGSFSGTTTTVGETTATISAADAHGGTAATTLQVTVQAAPAFTPASTNTLQRVRAGTGLRPLKATAAAGETLHFTLTGGALPAGISLNDDGSFAGKTGAAGDQTVTVQVADTHGGHATTTVRVVVFVPEHGGGGSVTPVPPALSVAGGVVTTATPAISGTASLPDGAAVSVSIDGAGYTATVSRQEWSVTVTTPLTVGMHEITASGTDADGRTGSATGTVTVKVAPTLTALPDRTNQVGAQVELAVSATGAPGSQFTYAAAGLPDGLGIDAATGVISGNPTGDGLYHVNVTVTETVAGGVTSRSFTWRILQRDAGSVGGTVTDAATGRPVTGARVTLMGADTAVHADPQITTAAGEYGWTAIPQGDYHILARKDGYRDYDSGSIHVGDAAVSLNFQVVLASPETHRHAAYIHGYPDGSFGPNRNITRAEVASVLAQLLGPAPGAGPEFADVSAGHWAAAAIATVAARGVMVGEPGGHFRPDDPVTRAEVAVIVSRLRQLAPGTASFPDVAGHWAEPYIGAAKGAGILSGYPDGTFQPQRPTTRAEFVTIMNRTFQRGPLVGMGASTFPDVPLDSWASGQVEEAATDHRFTVGSDGVERLAP